MDAQRVSTVRMTGKLTLLYMGPIRICISVSTRNRRGQNALSLFVAFVLLVSAGSAYSQFDYKFWMPPIWQTGNSQQNQPSELFITTPYPTLVNVHIETPDGTTFVFDGTVSTGTPLIIPSIILRPLPDRRSSGSE